MAWNPAWTRLLLLIGLGLLVTLVLSWAVARVLRQRFGEAHGATVGRVFRYLGLAVVVGLVLRDLGFDLGLLLGAAGILTVAIGFASQTAASNLISGLFLLAERPFVVGDVVDIGGRVGEVIALDLLSVKVRTFDNILLRVPNKRLLESDILNLTAFSIRRIDLRFTVGPKEDLARLRHMLEEMAERMPLCLAEPVPAFALQGFGVGGIDVVFSVWAAQEGFIDARTAFFDEAQRTLTLAGVDLSFGRRELTGPGGAPLSVRWVGHGGGACRDGRDRC